MRLLGFCLALALCVSASACSWTSPSGATYDLGGLTRSQDFTGSDPEYKYAMNVCGMASTSGCSAMTICQITEFGSAYNLGKYTTGQPKWAMIDDSNPGKGVRQTYTNGDECWMIGRTQERVVNVNYRCDQPKPSDPNHMDVKEDVGTCTFHINVDGVGCPAGGGAGGGGISGGSVFVILFFVGAFLYIAGGCFFKHRNKGTRGVESCPNIDFWRTIPGLVKDGCAYTWMMIRTSCKGNSGGYSQEGL